jgi:uncharacterized protein YjbI with pentapeptide repeats
MNRTVNMTGADLTNLHFSLRLFIHISLIRANLMGVSICSMLITASHFWIYNNVRCIIFDVWCSVMWMSCEHHWWHIDFAHANSQNVDLTFFNLTGSSITDEQLNSVKMYYRASLPNSAQVVRENQWRNGNANGCSLKYWHVHDNGTIYIQRENWNCLFQANGNRDLLTMSQRVKYYRVSDRKRFKHMFEVRIDIKNNANIKYHQ